MQPNKLSLTKLKYEQGIHDTDIEIGDVTSQELT